MRICPVGVELFHADGQTDGQTEMMKLIVAFRNFANVPKIGTDVMSLDSLTVYYYFVHVNHMILCF
jgi:hypothetical protein